MRQICFSRSLRIEHLEDRRPLAADFNEDATVDEFDLRNWQAGYGEAQVAQVRGDADGDGDVDGRDFLEWQRQHGPQQNNLIAYRPQSVYDPADTSTPSPIYDTFLKKPVREADEFSNTLGPGIRINYDDDDFSGQPDATDIGAITQENDLIEVKVERLPGQGNMVLQRTGALALYYDHDRRRPIPLDDNLIYTEPLDFINSNRVTVFVEWQSVQHGTSILNLLDASTFASQDSLRFHSFRSLIVAFGGLGQNPDDTDEDGSAGDPVNEEGIENREGIFDVAQSLYDTGWDVLAFNQNAENFGGDLPATEILKARRERFVERHAIIGYSYGGGATHDLIEDLYNWDNDGDGDLDSIVTDVGVYLDAVDQFGLNAENDWPEHVVYLLNIWQPNGMAELGGAALTNTEEMLPISDFDEFELAAEDHFTIDDDPQVQELIITTVTERLFFR